MKMPERLGERINEYPARSIQKIALWNLTGVNHDSAERQGKVIHSDSRLLSA
jgi:hypothetical protein